jgi:signal transduction histidine kinase
VSTRTSEDRERRARLADVISRRRQEIEHRWLDKIEVVIQRPGVTRTELRDSMPEYLVRLADGLRQADTAQLGGTKSWENVARQHAEDRVRLGFDIDHVVRDFIVLRQVLFAVVEEEHLDLRAQELGTVADLIEGAIAASVKSYIESRDYEARRLEAEHVGFITHELRNPLTTAMLGTAQLRKTVRVTGEQERVFGTVERSQRRLAELIEGVLLVERDVHELTPKTAETKLGQLISEPVASARLAADAKGLHLRTHFDPELVLQVDPKLAKSAIENVVQNAVKYTDAGNIDVDVEDGKDEVVIHVRDTGPGIAPEDLGTIFEPFKRGQSGKPGSGLGLAIARRAVEVQGGSIHAESTAPRGSHFWLTLPKPRD